MKGNEAAKTALKVAAVVLLLYFFLVSIALMQSAFRLFGADFAVGAHCMNKAAFPTAFNKDQRG